METQTSLDPVDFELQIPCRICKYVATREEELNWQMDDEHNINTDMHFETEFPCEICGKLCRTEADLTNHLKKHEYESLPSESQSLNNGIVMLSCNFFEKGSDGAKKEGAQ